jgi:hypothetical protein
VRGLQERLLHDRERWGIVGDRVKPLFAAQIDEPVLTEFRKICKAKRFHYRDVIEKLMVSFNEENKLTEQVVENAAEVVTSQ